MWNLVVFAVIGLLTGAAARLFYPGRQSAHILGTMLIGMVGALAGGLLSWGIWPVVEGQFNSGNLILSIGGAMVAITLGALVAYKRSLRGIRNPS
jgi:uncharacterized membrane protein YeaQ/YmgE (transglycosylase-associated protein family)